MVVPCRVGRDIEFGVAKLVISSLRKLVVNSQQWAICEWSHWLLNIMVVTVYGTVHTMDISTFSRDELAFVNRESPELFKVWLVLTALFWRFQGLQLKDLTTYARGPFFWSASSGWIYGYVHR